MSVNGMSHKSVIAVDSGKKLYRLLASDGELLGQFSLCPTDTGITKRYSKVLSRFEELHVDEEMDINEAVAEVEKIIMEQFDYLFGFPVSDSFFKNIRPLAIMENNETFALCVLRTIGNVIHREASAVENSLLIRIEESEVDLDGES